MDLIDRLIEISKLEDTDLEVCDTAGEAAMMIMKLRGALIGIKRTIEVQGIDHDDH